MRVAAAATLIVVTLLSAPPAMATGTLDCYVDDDGTMIGLHGIVPYGNSATLMQVEAEVQAKMPDVSADLAETSFSGDHQIQFWLDDLSLNVMLYREREDAGLPFGATTLTIKTTRTNNDEEGVYSGRYDVLAFEMPEGGDVAREAHAQGNIECVAG